MRRIYWITGLIVVLVVAGVLIYRGLASGQAQDDSSLQTATVTRGEVAATITGVGTVSSKQSATVSWQTSGKVEKVAAQIGQQVTAGALLASLDPGTLSTSIIQAQADLISAQNDLEELQKPQPLKIAEAAQALTQAQEDLENLLNPTAGAIAQAEIAVVDAQDAVDDAQDAVDALARGRANQQQIELARANYLLAQQKVERMQAIYEDTPGHHDEDPAKAMALSNLAGAENERDRALGTLNWYLGKPSQEEIDQANLEHALAQSQLAEAQATLARLQEPTPEDIDYARAMVESAQEALETARSGATEEELALAQTRVQVAQATLDQAYLTAPFAGMITDMDVLAGDLVSQGTQAFHIDDFSMLFVQLQVSEVDIHQVQVGQEATLTFDAISDREYQGTVTKIGMAATISQGVVNYPVTVQLTNPDESIFPGMTAAVTIVVEKHTGVLVVPNQALRTSSGQRTVTVLFEGRQISLPVTVGLTSASLSEVTSDQLREGDTVVVNGSASSTTADQFNRGGMMPGVDLGGGPDVIFP